MMKLTYSTLAFAGSLITFADILDHHNRHYDFRRLNGVWSGQEKAKADLCC